MWANQTAPLDSARTTHPGSNCASRWSIWDEVGQLEWSWPWECASCQCLHQRPCPCGKVPSSEPAPQLPRDIRKAAPAHRRQRHPTFEIATVERQTDRQTDRQRDGQTERRHNPTLTRSSFEIRTSSVEIERHTIRLITAGQAKTEASQPVSWPRVHQTQPVNQPQALPQRTPSESCPYTTNRPQPQLLPLLLLLLLLLPLLPFLLLLQLSLKHSEKPSFNFGANVVSAPRPADHLHHSPFRQQPQPPVLKAITPAPSIKSTSHTSNAGCSATNATVPYTNKAQTSPQWTPPTFPHLIVTKPVNALGASTNPHNSSLIHQPRNDTN